DLVPLLQWRWKRAFLREAYASVNRDPAHDSGIKKFVGPAAHFPDALIGPPPILANPIDQLGEMKPKIVGDGLGEFVANVNRVHQFAINVELKLVVGAVSNPHRTGFSVTLEMAKLGLDEILSAINAVHDLQGG